MQEHTHDFLKEDYFYENILSKYKQKERVDDDKMVIPSYHEYQFLLENNYTLPHLKSFAKHYKQKVSGSKKQLIYRLFAFLYLYNAARKIQKMARGKNLRKYLFYHGPGFKKRSLCTNTFDFLSMDDVAAIPYNQFFSYEDEQHFIYGFDVLSIYNLIYKPHDKVKSNQLRTKDIHNPFNNSVIAPEVMESLSRMIKLSKILKIEVTTTITNVVQQLTSKKSIELKALTLFQEIDALGGNFSNSQWLLGLNRGRLLAFLDNLRDIWRFRANHLTIETKRAICPPCGNPFFNINTNPLLELNQLFYNVLTILENFVNSGINNDSRRLGAYYVLGALTLVSEDAATCLPWLYEAVRP